MRDSFPRVPQAETDDEDFDHPAQMLSPLGAPLQGRWRIHGVFLPDEVLRKNYYVNALKYLPSVRDSIKRQLAAHRPWWEDHRPEVEDGEDCDCRFG